VIGNLLGAILFDCANADIRIRYGIQINVIIAGGRKGNQPTSPQFFDYRSREWHAIAQNHVSFLAGGR
jgi:hypothetical protein